MGADRIGWGRIGSDGSAGYRGERPRSVGAAGKTTASSGAVAARTMRGIRIGSECAGTALDGLGNETEYLLGRIVE